MVVTSDNFYREVKNQLILGIVFHMVQAKADPARGVG